MSQVLLNTPHPRTAIVALGANLDSSVGGPDQSLKHAVKLLNDDVKVKVISDYYQTPCFPQGAGPDYVNAVLTLETILPQQELLLKLHQIEASLGRVRKARWGSRTLDLDLIDFDNQIFPNHHIVQKWIDLEPTRQRIEVPDQLLLPHPRLHERAFVLVPLCEIWPNWRHPVLGKTAQQLLNEIPLTERAKVIAV